MATTTTTKPATAASPATLLANLATVVPAHAAQLLAMAQSKGLLADLPATANGKAIATALQGNIKAQQAFIAAVKGGQGNSTVAALAALFGTGTAKANTVANTGNAAGQGRKWPNNWVLVSINCAGNPKNSASAVRFALYAQLGVGATLGALKQAGMRAADFSWDTAVSRNFVTLGPATMLAAKPAKPGTKRASNGVSLAAPAPVAPAPTA